MEDIADIFNKTSNPAIKKVTRGNFTKVNNNLLDSCDFDGYEKMVLIALERFNFGKNKCWASHETIAKTSGFGKTKIKKVLKELERRGSVIKGKDKKHLTNIYYSSTNIYRPPSAHVISLDETGPQSPRAYK